MHVCRSCIQGFFEDKIFVTKFFYYIFYFRFVRGTLTKKALVSLREKETGMEKAGHFGNEFVVSKIRPVGNNLQPNDSKAGAGALSQS